VVHGKGSLLSRMPGDAWQKFANLRVLYGYMFGQPGKKLLFMGDEWGQGREWNHDTSLDWHQADIPQHAGVLRWVLDLNRVYREEKALTEGDCNSAGFDWVDCHDAGASVLSWLRKSTTTAERVLVLCNFTPVPREGYRVGVPYGSWWKELLNSDATVYGGAGLGNKGGLQAEPQPWHGQPCSLLLTLPPLSVVFFKGVP
jgi:1,4-alpha-glucan branching enzyme